MLTPTPTADARWTVQAAQGAAQRGELERWVHAYLAAGPWANPGLSGGLRLQRRWWRGPVEVAHSQLEQVCGPEAHLEYRVDAAAWEEKVSGLAASITNRMHVPPLITEHRAGHLSVRDGNHRLEAFRRLGFGRCWMLICYNTLEDYRADAGR